MRRRHLGPALLVLPCLFACGTAPVPGPEPAGAGAQGGAEPRVLLHEPGVENAYPRLSGDGRRIVFQSNRGGRWQLWLLDITTGEQRRLTDDAFNNNFVDWSADEAWVAFVSDRDGNEEIYRMRLDGGDLERLTDDPGRDIHPYFAPDGKSLLFNSTRGNGSLDLYRLDLASRAVARLTDSEASDTCGRFSPDMQHVVFLQNDATRDDVMVMDLATRAVMNLTNTPRVMDGWPMYSADGRWIYYSTTASGAHSVHRIRPDGAGDETLTQAAPGEEDGRAFVSRDGRTLIFNRRRAGGIDILALDLTDRD